jgi:hypothetical protein
MNRLARWLSWALAGGALLSFLVMALPPRVRTAWERLSDAVRHSRETDLEANVRLFGSDSVAAYQTIQSTLRPGEPYILVDYSPTGSFERFWVRYELAPHPALFAGNINQKPGRNALRRLARETVRWVVMCSEPGNPPALAELRDILEKSVGNDGR